MHCKNCYLNLHGTNLENLTRSEIKLLRGKYRPSNAEFVEEKRRTGSAEIDMFIPFLRKKVTYSK